MIAEKRITATDKTNAVIGFFFTDTNSDNVISWLSAVTYALTLAQRAVHGIKLRT